MVLAELIEPSGLIILTANPSGTGKETGPLGILISRTFFSSVQLIAQDDDASWCGFANAPIIQDRNGLSYCAIPMPEYQVEEDGGE